MSLYTGRDSGVALVAATTKTIIQLVSSSTRPIRLLELGVSFDGVSGTAVPVTVDLVRQTTAGTASALTLVKENSGDAATVVTTAQKTFTAEPTTTDLLRTWLVTPAGGLFVMQFPLGREPAIGVSERIAIRCTAPAGVNTAAYLTFEE